MSLSCVVLLWSTGATQARYPGDDAKKWLESGWSWTKAPWSRTSAPYLEEAKRLHKAIDGAADVNALYEQTKKRALARPTEALAQYAWGYVAYYGAAYGKTLTGQDRRARLDRELGAVYVAMGIPKGTNAREYVRIRMLVVASWRSDCLINELAERLVATDPEDDCVKWVLVQRYVSTPHKNGNLKGLRFAQELKKKWPKVYQYAWKEATAYHLLFLSTKEERYRKEAARCYAEIKPIVPADQQAELERCRRLLYKVSAAK